MDFVLDFCRLELSGVEGDWVQAVLVVSLGKDSSESEIRCIRYDYDRLFQIEVRQD
jgi:hypothetical protein